jgi:hypothetical protein
MIDFASRDVAPQLSPVNTLAMLELPIAQVLEM